MYLVTKMIKYVGKNFFLDYCKKIAKMSLGRKNSNLRIGGRKENDFLMCPLLHHVSYFITIFC